MSTVAIPRPRPLRSPGGKLLALAVAGLAALVLLVAVISGPGTCDLGGAESTELADAGAGEEAIPSAFAEAYRDVAQKSGVPAPVLAAVGYIETKHGRLTNTSSAGAQGPMQFLPSTWSALGCAGSIGALEPAVTCAAKYLTMLADEPSAKRPGTDRWTYAMCRYNGGCANGIAAEAGYGAAGEVAGKIAKEYGYVPGSSATPTLAGVNVSTSPTCTDPAAATGSVGDVPAAVAPFMGKSWSGSIAAGMDPLGWPAGTPWCMLFVQNILKRLGIDVPTPRTAHSSDPYRWATTNGWGTVVHGPSKPASPSVKLEPGDLILYGPASNSAHINMVEKVDDRGVITVGGNQGCANGNGVCERGPVKLTGGGGSLRWTSGDTRPIWGIVRPPAPGAKVKAQAT